MRYDRMSGLGSEQLDELVWRIEDQLEEPWHKGIGRPKDLSLREAVVVACGYMRQNIIRKSVLRFGWKTRVAPELDHLLDAIDAIDREHRENAEINDQHSPIESVELVKRTDVRRGLVHRVAVTRHVGAEIPVQRRRAIPTVVQALLDPIGWRGD